MHVDCGKNSTRDGKQVRRENDLAFVERDLLEQLAVVAVREDAVGGEVVGCVHEMRFGGGSLSSAADAAFGIGDNAVVEIDETGGNQRLQSKDDGGCVAAGVRNKTRVRDLRAM